MHLNVSVPKEQVDKMLREQISSLKKENAKLKAQIFKMNAAIAITDQQVTEIAEMHKEFRDLCDKWAAHDMCGE